MDGHLINQRRMHFQSRVSATTVHKLLFADDCTLSATTEGDMKRCMELFTAASKTFGLITNTEETVVMHQPPSNTAHNAPQISANDAQLQVMDHFTYLGSTLSRNAKIGNEVTRRISKASQAFGHLQKTVGTIAVSIPTQS
ncbi:hypothetical protein SprV_0200840400 [Sparganum proliferum]